MNEKWFALSIGEIEKKLKTNAASGLSRKAARSAWYRTGTKAGSLFIRKHKSIGKMWGEIFSDFALVILLLAAIFAVLFDDKSMGATVLTISALSLAVSFAFYYHAQRTMEQMNLYFLPTAKVIRGGKLYRVSFENVVAGDVIILEKGDIVCGDARLITSDKLSVSMRIDKNKYLSLKKQALGVIDQNEKDPKKLMNIVHAGSVISEGSARAVVYATGRFTYLGAMTGGIVESYNDNVPKELLKMRKICSYISIVAMICILPFSVLSLLLSHMNGGTPTLSYTFLTALAICASSMTQLSCTVCKIFFVNKIKEISLTQNSAVVRTTDAFDKFSELDYLFMLDGSALTDGVLHFDSAFTSEGEIKSFTSPTPTMSALFELAMLYNSAESEALTVGINLPERFKKALDEFLSYGNADREALKIRCPVRSYMPGTITDPTDRVYYTDTNRNMVLCVSRTEEIFSQCQYGIISGRIQPLTTVGRDKLRHTYNMHTSKGKTVLVFSLSTLENAGNNSGKIFVGAVVLREGIDKNAMPSISALEKKGVKVISFVGVNCQADAPQIPIETHYGNKVAKHDFIRENLPVTYNFGEINTYYGFNETDIYELMKFAKAQNSSVGVIGFSEYAPSIVKSADVFISCSPIINVFSAQSEKELYTLEMAGARESASCVQTLKASSDVIIQRPDSNKGGIASLVQILSLAKAAYRNLNSFFTYTLAAQLIRILIVALPMAVGKPILDARHVLLCSYIIDIFVLIMLASDKTAVPNNRKRYGIRSLKEQIFNSRTIMLACLISSLSAILLPMAFDFIGVFGQYLYKIEYLFCAMMWLHFTLAYYIRYGTIFNVKAAIKNKLLLGLILGIIAFVVLVTFVTPIGLLFDIVSNPLPYFILSFVPTLIFISVIEIFRALSKTKRI